MPRRDRRLRGLGWLLAAALGVVLTADLVTLSQADPPPDAERLGLEDILARLPHRNEGRFGRTGDVLNLVFVGEEAALIDALEGAGWARVPRTIGASLAAGLADLARHRRLRRFPPMNDYRVYGRVQDLNLAIATRHIESRHHFRLWRTPFRVPDGRPLWWGSGNYDLSIRWRDLSHRPDPSMDFERDYVADTLTGRAELRWLEVPGLPREGRNDKGYPFRTDGRVLVASVGRQAYGLSEGGSGRRRASPTSPESR